MLVAYVPGNLFDQILFEADIDAPAWNDELFRTSGGRSVVPKAKRGQNTIHLGDVNSERSQTLNAFGTKFYGPRRLRVRIDIDNIFGSYAAGNFADELNASGLRVYHVLAISAAFKSSRGLGIHPKLARGAPH